MLLKALQMDPRIPKSLPNYRDDPLVFRPSLPHSLPPPLPLLLSRSPSLPLSIPLSICIYVSYKHTCVRVRVRPQTISVCIDV